VRRAVAESCFFRWAVADRIFLLQAARVLLRVDDVVQATRKERQQEQGAPSEEPMQE
jgi:hypothetical protein